MPVATEIVYLLLKDGANPEETGSRAESVLKQSFTTLSNQPGYLRCYWGIQAEDPKTLVMSVDWEDVQKHKDFMNTDEYGPFVAQLAEIFDFDTSPPFLFHVNFTSDSVPARESPVTEVAPLNVALDTSDADKSAFEAKALALIEHLKNEGKASSYALGWVIEDLDNPNTPDGKSKALLALIGWQTVEDHLAAQETSSYKDLLEPLKNWLTADGMRKGANPAGCITRSLAPTTVQPLWITDAVLANAYQRFAWACSHRRHGSNVPGPLEARRRAAKRKNTSWAQLRTHSPIEPALLFGQQNHAEWWQSAGKQEDGVHEKNETPLPSLLDWLLPPEPPPPPSSFFDLSDYGHLPPPPPAPPPPSPRGFEAFEEQSFRAHIQDCKHVQEMRETFVNLGLDHDQKSAAIEAVLAQVLTLESPARETAEFLTEPCFNLPGTNHHLSLLLRLKPSQDLPPREEEEAGGNLARLREYFMAPHNWQILHRAFCRAARLGLIEPSSFQRIMDHLYGSSVAPAKECQREAWHQEAGELLASFKESRIFELGDLSQAWVSGFVDKVLSEPVTAASLKLLLGLKAEDGLLSMIQDSRLTSLTTSGLNEAAAFLQALSKSRLSEVQEWMQRQPGAGSPVQSLSHLRPGRELARQIEGTKDQEDSSFEQDIAMQTLPDRILAHLLASVTEQIVVKTWRGECGPEVMYHWGTVISSLNCISFKRWVLDQSNFYSMCSSLSSRLSQQERFLISVWILVKLCWSGSTATGLSEQLSLREAFDQLFPALLRTFNFGPEQLKIFTQKLPFEGTFVRKLSLLLSREHRIDLAPVAINSGEKKALVMTEVAFSNLMDDHLYRQMLATSVDGLCELGESINADLATFAQISRKLIHGDKYAIRVVKRLLKHNLPFKTTLGLMERLALAFALAPSLTPRSALAQVQWCYVFLHRYGAPITPAITRALWHAGVTRYRGNGPSYTQMHWVLKIVSDVEGKGVAGMLLWNSDFRKRREEILRTVADEIVAEEAAEL
ncbi:hypothetical protein DV738_g1339, partial [Chaetothyriales sp. CBS 135597]